MKKSKQKAKPRSKPKVERYVTQKAYALLRKKSAAYINKLVGEGVIVLVDKKVDVKQADRALASRPRPELSGKTKPKSSPGKRSSAPARRPGRVAQGSVGRVSATRSLQAGRAEEVQYKAKILKLDYETRIGLVVLKSEVLKAEQKKNETMRSVFRTLPREIAALYQHGMTKSEVEDLIRAEINRRLDRFSRDPLGIRPAVVAVPDAGELAVEATSTPSADVIPPPAGPGIEASV